MKTPSIVSHFYDTIFFMKDQDLQYSNSLLYAAELLIKASTEAGKKVDKESNIGIGHEETRVLETIVLNPGVLQIDIAKKILVNRSYVCKLLTKLIDNGYVSQKKAIRGKKQVTIKNFATDKGLAMYHKTQELSSKSASQIISDSELEKINETRDFLLELSQRIIKNFNLKF